MITFHKIQLTLRKATFKISFPFEIFLGITYDEIILEKEKINNVFNSL